MNRRRNGIIIAPLAGKTKKRKVLHIKASSDAGKFAYEVTPKCLFELAKTYEDGVTETVFTPFAKDMHALMNQGYAFVATHKTKIPTYIEIAE